MARDYVIHPPVFCLTDRATAQRIRQLVDKAAESNPDFAKWLEEKSEGTNERPKKVKKILSMAKDLILLRNILPEDLREYLKHLLS